jgi:hypothetical protein
MSVPGNVATIADGFLRGSASFALKHGFIGRKRSEITLEELITAAHAVRIRLGHMVIAIERVYGREAAVNAIMLARQILSIQASSLD